jgi:glycolate oxidase FAD binding subunit
MEALKPASENELARTLAECAAAHRTIRLGGHFSKDALLHGLQPEVTVTTCAMRRVLEYEPRDLTISVEAGLPWSELSQLLAENRQIIPLDPPWYESATVGGVVATNFSGPRRRLYGTARDLVIGMRFATLQGDVAQSGGMVVKNVAGLDMAKLLIGSWGALAAIAVVNFKLNPMPPETRTFALEFETAGAAIDARDRILQSVLQPAALDILNPSAAAGFELPARFILLLQAGGSPAVLKRYSSELPGARVIDCSIWEQIREFVPRTGARSVLSTLTGLREVLRNAQGPAIARAGSGIAYVVNGPAVPQSSDLMKSVKAVFDPEGLLCAPSSL